VIYPRVDAQQIETGGAAFVARYLIKLQPATRTGELELLISPGPSPAEKFRICRLAVTHIGANFPCLRQPSATPLPSDNMAVQYGSVEGEETKECGEPAKITFKVCSGQAKNDILKR